MEKIVSKIYELIKNTENLIELEERIQWFMYDVFSTLLGEVFTKIDQAIVKKKQAEGWTVKEEIRRPFSSRLVLLVFNIR